MSEEVGSDDEPTTPGSGLPERRPDVLLAVSTLVDRFDDSIELLRRDLCRNLDNAGHRSNSSFPCLEMPRPIVQDDERLHQLLRLNSRKLL